MGHHTQSRIGAESVVEQQQRRLHSDVRRCDRVADSPWDERTASLADIVALERLGHGLRFALDLQLARGPSAAHVQGAALPAVAARNVKTATDSLHRSASSIHRQQRRTRENLANLGFVNRHGSSGHAAVVQPRDT